MSDLVIENAVLKNLLRETVAAYDALQRPLGGGGGDGTDVPAPASAAPVSDASDPEVEILRETLRLLLLENGDAVVSTDAQATVVALNPVAEKLMGLQASAASGMPLLHALLLVGSDDQGVVLDLAPCLLEGKDLNLPAGVAVERRDGYRCPVNGRLMPIRDGAGRVSGLLIVMHPLDDTYLRAP